MSETPRLSRRRFLGADVVIVGAGFAGLTAARELAEAAAEVLDAL